MREGGTAREMLRAKAALRGAEERGLSWSTSASLSEPRDPREGVGGSEGWRWPGRGVGLGVSEERGREEGRLEARERAPASIRVLCLLRGV